MADDAATQLLEEVVRLRSRSRRAKGLVSTLVRRHAGVSHHRPALMLEYGANIVNNIVCVILPAE
jgi:hypothetical protein